MGCGKSTIGPLLATRLGWRFEDHDTRIERTEGRTIAEIFQASGEAAFRAMESAMLTQTLADSNQQGPLVLALGGGAFASEQNRAQLQNASQNGNLLTVFLDAPVDALWQRCRTAGTTRPLIADRDSFQRLYEQRQPLYLLADIHIATAGKLPHEVADAIVERLPANPG